MKGTFDPAWANWFVGFCDGEASFTYRNTTSVVSPVIPRFKLTVQDDHALIVEINEVLFAGGYVMIDQAVKAKRSSGSGFQNRSEIDITDKARLVKLVMFFDTFLLRSHKLAEYKIWRELVAVYCGQHNQRRSDRMIDLVERLTAGRTSGMSASGRRKLNDKGQKSE